MHACGCVECGEEVKCDLVHAWCAGFVSAWKKRKVKEKFTNSSQNAILLELLKTKHTHIKNITNKQQPQTVNCRQRNGWLVAHLGP